VRLQTCGVGTDPRIVGSFDFLSRCVHILQQFVRNTRLVKYNNLLLSAETTWRPEATVRTFDQHVKHHRSKGRQ